MNVVVATFPYDLQNFELWLHWKCQSLLYNASGVQRTLNSFLIDETVGEQKERIPEIFHLRIQIFDLGQNSGPKKGFYLYKHDTIYRCQEGGKAKRGQSLVEVEQGYSEKN